MDTKYHLITYFSDVTLITVYTQKNLVHEETSLHYENVRPFTYFQLLTSNEQSLVPTVYVPAK